MFVVFFSFLKSQFVMIDFLKFKEIFTFVPNFGLYYSSSIGLPHYMCWRPSCTFICLWSELVLFFLLSKL